MSRLWKKTASKFHNHKIDCFTAFYFIRSSALSDAADKNSHGIITYRTRSNYQRAHDVSPINLEARHKADTETSSIGVRTYM